MNYESKKTPKVNSEQADRASKLASTDWRKVQHDFRNDLVSLMMNLEALRLSRDDERDHQELIELMQGSLKLLSERIEMVIDSLPDDANG
ncbi:HAMP domain-containing histidine kinase [Rhodopirellula sp. MGV]|uniref:HAMP domain-containing histidine kinase n=1 Tax=Rhodopirellula sp. MGV TaxID=2023130 RepID=UPI000B97A516|nr:HAMP domain-containing histidine kinase [Rhodopirellula sp. MGV]OYP36858.1 hypothetical protein CGZ80_07365 [Rhodopirellula sp. MGV]PNY34054.1 hypothetical protein C2E31_25335 [Rhodopirellula baltica]